MTLIRKQNIVVAIALLFTLAGCASVPLYDDELAKCSELLTTPTTRAELTVVNTTAEPQSLFWVQPHTAVLTHYKDIAAGESHKQDTFIGHLWTTKRKNGDTTSTVCASNVAFTHELKL